MTSRRVIISGMGVLTPTANNTPDFTDALREGRSGIQRLQSFDVGDSPYPNGGELKAFDPGETLTRLEMKRLDRASLMVLVATQEALKMSQLDIDMVDLNRVGICLGTTLGGMVSAGQYYRVLKNKHKHYSSKLLDYPLHSAGSHVSVKYGITGPNIAISTACSSGNVAIGYGSEFIRSGASDIMIVGGFDPMSEFTWSGFGSLRNVSPDVCRPFDKNRKGLLLGEGAGILILENLDHCQQRGGHVLAEFLGYGMSSDAYHMTAPDIAGRGSAQAMIQAIHVGGLQPTDIDYVSAHGTGTHYNDLIETRAIKKALGDHAFNIPVSSIKSMIGHTLGACGAIEAIASILSINHGFIPPTINYETPDPQCDLDYVPNKARQCNINNVLSNNLGFGGNNCSIVISKFKE